MRLVSTVLLSGDSNFQLEIRQKLLSVELRQDPLGSSLYALSQTSNWIGRGPGNRGGDEDGKGVEAEGQRRGKDEKEKKKTKENGGGKRWREGNVEKYKKGKDKPHFTPTNLKSWIGPVNSPTSGGYIGY